MSLTVRERLETTLHEFVGSRRSITEATRLFHDLGLSGHDAFEFLESVHKTFNTRLEGFEFEAYFPDELDGFILHIAKRLFGHRAKRYKDFAFGHLVQVVEAGAWFDPPP